MCEHVGIKRSISGNELLRMIRTKRVSFNNRTVIFETFERMLMTGIPFNTVYLQSDTNGYVSTLDVYGNNLFACYELLAQLYKDDKCSTRLYNIACDLNICVFMFHPDIKADVNMYTL